MRFRLQLAIAALLFSPIFCDAQDAIGWNTDFQKAIEKAASEQKLVLLHFYGNHCPPCKKMDKDVFSRADVADAISNGFVAVKVDTQQNAALTQQFRIESIPADIVATPDGKIIERRIGGIHVDGFLSFLDKHRIAPKPQQMSAKSTESSGFSSTYRNNFAVGFQDIEMPLAQGVYVSQPNMNEANTLSPASFLASDNAVPAPVVFENKADRNSVEPTILGLVFEGYCPVELAENGRWLQGDFRIAAVEKNAVFLFYSEAAREKFKKSPVKYIPAESGCDIVEKADKGKTTLGLRKFGVQYKEKTYLFTTKENQQVFLDNPAKYVAAQWTEIVP